jgi:uncharacterized protein
MAIQSNAMIASRTNSAVFVDTSGWIALLNADDQYHAAAAQALSALGKTRRPLITTDWVLAETGNGLSRHSLGRRRFVEAVATFRASKHSRLIHIDADLFESSLTLYGQSDDKTWGLVDCASFTVMWREGIFEALTADRHFEQTGFRCLLQQPG